MVEVVDVDPRRDAERSHVGKGDAEEPTKDERNAPLAERPTRHHQSEMT